MTNIPPSEPEGRILPFRRRGSLFGRSLPPPSPVQNLEQFEHSGGEDDYRHRMIVNAAALVAVVLLIAGGIWIADSMALLRKNQDCALSGKRNCTPIPLPTAPPN